MKKDLLLILADYYNCFYYDENRMKAAFNGDVIEISNVGTDIARSNMFTKAVECWDYIVESGIPTNPETYNNLGVSYFYGNGVEVNYETAVHSYQKATAVGHPIGKYNFAFALEQGKGIKTDLNRAIKLYKQVAESGVNQAIEARIRLGKYDELSLSFYPRNFNDTSFLCNEL